MKLVREMRRGADGTDAVHIRGINRGMVFWADVPRAHSVGSEQWKRRPWLVVSADSIHQRLPIVVAVPLTSQLPKAGTLLVNRVLLAASDFVPNPDGVPLTVDGVALTEQVRSLAHERLDGEPAGSFPLARMADVDAGLRYVLRLQGT